MFLLLLFLRPWDCPCSRTSGRKSPAMPTQAPPHFGRSIFKYVQVDPCNKGTTRDRQRLRRYIISRPWWWFSFQKSTRHHGSHGKNEIQAYLQWSYISRECRYRCNRKASLRLWSDWIAASLISLPVSEAHFTMVCQKSWGIKAIFYSPVALFRCTRCSGVCMVWYIAPCNEETDHSTTNRRRKSRSMAIKEDIVPTCMWGFGSHHVGTST